MGEHWDLRTKQRQLYWGKNYVPDQVALLFTDSDLEVQIASDSGANEEIDDTSTRDVFVYRSTVGTLRARLRLQGFDVERAFAMGVAYLNAEQNDDEYRPHWMSGAPTYGSLQELLQAAIRWASRQDLPSSLVGPTNDDLRTVWQDVTEAFDDPRFAIALQLRGLRGNTSVALDLSWLLMGGWLAPSDRPHAAARARLTSRVNSAGSIIVVTEGRSDAKLLSLALHLAAPGVATQFTFLDFEAARTPGGTDHVVRLMTSLAAAGVVNRVVAVLDNDAAGNHALQQLRRVPLPQHFFVTVLPQLPHARRYPTVGPDGPSNSDVNGRAVAVEMLFGPAILSTGGNGALPPVRWSAPIGKPPVYQGALEYKGPVQAAIIAALEDAGSLTDLHPEIAQGCQLVAKMLLAGSDTIEPPMSTEFSPLITP